MAPGLSAGRREARASDLLLRAVPRLRLRRLVPVVPVSASEGQRPMSAAALYGYLAFPAHERPSYVVRTREGKVVVPDVEIQCGICNDLHSHVSNSIISHR